MLFYFSPRNLKQETADYYEREPQNVPLGVHLHSFHTPLVLAPLRPRNLGPI